MGPAWWILVILRGRHRDFAVAAYQDHEHRYPRAGFISCCRASVSDAWRFTEWSRWKSSDMDGQVSRPSQRERASQTPYNSWRNYLRRDRVASLCGLVLACVSNCAEILSPSLLRRRRDPNRVFLPVLAHCTTDFGIQSHAACLTHCAHRFVCPEGAESELLSSFPLVA